MSCTPLRVHELSSAACKLSLLCIRRPRGRHSVPDDKLRLRWETPQQSGTHRCLQPHLFCIAPLTTMKSAGLLAPIQHMPSQLSRAHLLKGSLCDYYNLYI